MEKLLTQGAVLAEQMATDLVGFDMDCDQLLKGFGRRLLPLSAPHPIQHKQILLWVPNSSHHPVSCSGLLALPIPHYQLINKQLYQLRAPDLFAVMSRLSQRALEAQVFHAY